MHPNLWKEAGEALPDSRISKNCTIRLPLSIWEIEERGNTSIWGRFNREA